jgi:hypothetical protein
MSRSVVAVAIAILTTQSAMRSNGPTQPFRAIGVQVGKP